MNINEANNKIDQTIKAIKKKKQEQNNQQIAENLQPSLEKIETSINETKEEVKNNNLSLWMFLQSIFESITDIKLEPPQINVAPPVIPKIEVPKAEVEVKIPEIKLPIINVPEPRVTVNIPEIKIPPIKVPKPEVTVNIPKQEPPIVNIPETKFPNKMDVSLSEVNRTNPVPVQLVDNKGNPYIAISGGGGGGKYVNVKDNVLEALNYGALSSIGATALQLTSTSIKTKSGVQVKASNSNTGTVYVGTSHVTAGSADATDGFELGAGESIVLPIDNVNKIYCIGSAAGQKVFWIAM